MKTLNPVCPQERRLRNGDLVIRAPSLDAVTLLRRRRKAGHQRGSSGRRFGFTRARTGTLVGKRYVDTTDRVEGWHTGRRVARLDGVAMPVKQAQALPSRTERENTAILLDHGRGHVADAHRRVLLRTSLTYDQLRRLAAAASGGCANRAPARSRFSTSTVQRRRWRCMPVSDRADYAPINYRLSRGEIESLLADSIHRCRCCAFAA